MQIRRLAARLRYAAILCRVALFIIAAPFSAIMIVGAFVLVEVTAGITEASMTRSPSIPCTCNSLSTTLVGCEPIMQVQSLAPNARVTVYPWREPPELKERTINRVRTFLKAHQPMRAAVQ